MASVWHRLVALVHRRQIADDVDSEVAFHIAMRREQLERDGVAPDEAERQARRQFGNAVKVREDTREMWTFPALDSIAQDLRIAARTLRKTPGFTAVAVASLALSIGANTAVFTVVDTLLLRPPPFEGADRLYWIYGVNKELGFTVDDAVAPASGDFVDWRSQTRSFDHMAAWRNWWFSVAGPDHGDIDAEQVRGVHVSPAFFDMLGVEATLGRTFRADEEEPGRDRVTVITHGFWTRRFGADPTVIGATILVDGRPFTVVGVLPADFYFLRTDTALFMPLTVDPEFLNGRRNYAAVVLARLSPGVTLAQAQADMDRVNRDLERAFPATNTGWGTMFRSVFPFNRHLEPTFWILLGSVGCVLLVACINLATLLLARSSVRRREMAVRVAIGASRARLVRQLLTESALLAAFGTVGGVLVAAVGLRLVTPLIPVTEQLRVARAFTFELDPRALVFTLAVAALTVLVFGLLPALQASRTHDLRVAGSSRHNPAAGRALLVAEIAMSLVLLVGATLLIQSLWNLQRVDPGFQPDRLLTLQLWLAEEKYPEPESLSQFYREVIRRLDAYPEVEAAATVSTRPFLGWALVVRLEIPGRPPPPEHDNPYVGVRAISPDYFSALGAPLIRGRVFRETDGPDNSGVAIVNEAMVRRFFPNEDPIGRQIRAISDDTGPWRLTQTTDSYVIVGVVGDVKEFRLRDRVESVVYLPTFQNPGRYSHLLVRTEADPTNVSDLVQREIQAIDSDLGVYGVRTMDAILADAVSEPRLTSMLLWVFAVVAVVLVGIGVYGVSAYSVSQRSREIAVRMALGAAPFVMFRRVIQHAATLATVGVVLGVVGALVFARALSGVLYGVAATDLVVLLVGAAVVFLAVLSAACRPAWQATRMDPMQILRAD